MRAKSFFYVSLGILALAVAYHLGASTATAQAPGNSVVAMPDNQTVVTANGDLYWSVSPITSPTFQLVGNVFGGSPVSTTQTTFGAVKLKGR